MGLPHYEIVDSFLQMNRCIDNRFQFNSYSAVLGDIWDINGGKTDRHKFYPVVQKPIKVMLVFPVKVIINNKIDLKYVTTAIIPEFHLNVPVFLTDPELVEIMDYVILVTMFDHNSEVFC